MVSDYGRSGSLYLLSMLFGLTDDYSTEMVAMMMDVYLLILFILIYMIIGSLIRKPILISLSMTAQLIIDHKLNWADASKSAKILTPGEKAMIYYLWPFVLSVLFAFWFVVFLFWTAVQITRPLP